MNARPDPAPRTNTVTNAAAAASTAALVCAACCVLPFALPAAVLATTGGVVAWFAKIAPWVSYAAAVFVVVGWLSVWRRSANSNAKPAISTILVMGAATVMLVSALAWPFSEPYVTTLLTHSRIH